jgi:ATP-binding cassette subfamily B protein
VIFGADAWDNIGFGRPDATGPEIRAAAEAAHAAEFLDALPRGFATFLGEKGVRLSGGQRQRLAIARAILPTSPSSNSSKPVRLRSNPASPSSQ